MMIYGLGEIVLDIIFKDDKPQTAVAGGSVLNSLFSLAHKGCETTLISQVGEDFAGNLIFEQIEKSGINTNFINRSNKLQTSLALAFLNEKNDAKYQFYKDRISTDSNWKLPQIKQNDLLLMSSSFCVSEPGLQFIDKLIRENPIIFYDPNYRRIKELTEEEQAKRILQNISRAQIVRASDEDFQKAFGIQSAAEAWQLVNKMGDKQFIYSCGSKGVYFFNREFHFHIPSKEITPVSTIGAGDTLNAGIIYGIRDRNIVSIKKTEWEAIISIAIEWASEVCLSINNHL